MRSSFLGKGKSFPISYQDLAKILTPKPMGKVHKPVAFKEIVDTLNDVMGENGFEKDSHTLTISNHGLKLFGILRYKHDKETGLALGFVSSNDESTRFKLIAGAHVWVCSNGCMSADTPIFAKYHTTHLSVRDEVLGCLEEVKKRYAKIDHQIERMKNASLKKEQAESLICQMAVGDAPVIPLRLLPDVYNNYFAPDKSHTDCRGENKWSLHNAVTRASRILSLPMQLKMSTGASKLLGFQLAS